jgi:hypothetical protein
MPKFLWVFWQHIRRGADETRTRDFLRDRPGHSSNFVSFKVFENRNPVRKHLAVTKLVATRLGDKTL